MSKMIKIKSPDGKTTDVLSVQNANDMIQHLGWTHVSFVDVADGKKDIVQAQDVINNARNIVATAEKADGAAAPSGEKAEVMSAREVAEINKAAKATKASK